MTQIFEVLEVREFPYFVTIDIDDVPIVGEVINVKNSRKVYLLVDHNKKKIWTFNGRNSPFKLQIYGGILAGMLRKQLKLFYRVYALNMYSTESPEFQEVMEQSIGPGMSFIFRNKCHQMGPAYFHINGSMFYQQQASRV